MKKKLFLLIFVVAAATASGASAASIFDITFPVAELGGCADQASCKVYCDDAAHQQACTQFAVDHGFVSKENASHSEQIKQKIKDAGGGPGGCVDENACRSYCQDPAHLDACVAFGEAHGLIDQKNLQQIKKSGLVSGPGGCTGDQCRTYCADAGHAEECLSFAQKNNLISSAEAARAKKFIAVSAQGGPGGCTGAQCRDYCSDPSHHDECFAFAKKNGLITQDQANQSEAGQKIQQTVRESGGPGGCKDDTTCKDYCTDPSHVEECVAFASAHGGVSSDQARRMLKDFTEQKAHASGDFNSSQDVEQFQQESDQKFQQFKQLEEQFRGPDSQELGGGFSGEQGQTNQNGENGENGGGNAGSGGQGGKEGMRGSRPGRGQFGGPHSSQPQQGAGAIHVGPGGCNSPAECIKYCTEHREECFGGSDRSHQEQEKGQEQGGACCPRPGDASSGLKLRGGLLREIKKEDLPQGFDKLSPDERGRMLRDKSQQLQERQQEKHSDRPGSFPVRPGESSDKDPGEFPGRDGSFPSQRFTPGPGEGLKSPEGFHPPEGSLQQQGGFPPPSPLGEPFRQSEGTFAPPPSGMGTLDKNSSGSFSQPPPSSGNFSAPPPPSGGGFMPPPSGSGFMPPPPPSGLAPFTNFFAVALEGLRR